VSAFFARLKWCVQESSPPTNAGQPDVAVTLIEVLFVIDPLVPVTVTVKSVPAGTEQPTAMVRVDVAGDGGRVTLVELKDRVTSAVVVEAVRPTVPEKPLIFVAVMVDVPLVPVSMAREDGLAERLSSEVAVPMMNVAVALRTRLPLVPVTSTAQVPVVSEDEVNVSIELAVALGARLTLLGLMLHVGQNNDRHNTGSVRLTVPVNPLMLVSVIVEWADAPGVTSWEAGFAAMEKSLEAVKVAVCTVSGTG
jgi:hypothetical protein